MIIFYSVKKAVADKPLYWIVILYILPVASVVSLDGFPEVNETL